MTPLILIAAAAFLAAVLAIRPEPARVPVRVRATRRPVQS